MLWLIRWCSAAPASRLPSPTRSIGLSFALRALSASKRTKSRPRDGYVERRGLPQPRLASLVRTLASCALSLCPRGRGGCGLTGGQSELGDSELMMMMLVEGGSGWMSRPAGKALAPVGARRCAAASVLVAVHGMGGRMAWAWPRCSGISLGSRTVRTLQVGEKPGWCDT
jgi:hypothetical protein